MSKMNNYNNYIELISSDGISYIVPVTNANISKFIKIITDETDMEDRHIESIPLLKVNNIILNRIVDFMYHYYDEPMVNIEKPLVTNTIGDVVQSWYSTFIEEIQNNGILYDIVNAANYLHIQPLLELSCAMVALSIKEKSSSEIEKSFTLIDC